MPMARQRRRAGCVTCERMQPESVGVGSKVVNVCTTIILCCRLLLLQPPLTTAAIGAAIPLFAVPHSSHVLFSAVLRPLQLLPLLLYQHTQA